MRSCLKKLGMAPSSNHSVQIWILIIILNSPRIGKRNNSEYENEEYTSLIDNSLIEFVSEPIQGFGDYCGLKDCLGPTGSNGQGAALILLYNFQKNKFYIIVNKNKELGQNGFTYLIPAVRGVINELDPDNDCIAFKKIFEMGYNSFQNWILVTIMRYISQIKKGLS